MSNGMRRLKLPPDLVDGTTWNLNTVANKLAAMAQG
jgi:hypothetical protein